MKHRIHIVLFSDLPRCEHCGTPLGTPGLCAACAESVYEVERITRVSVPLSKLIEPADLLEDKPCAE